jgi:hypothetical protein
MADSVILQAPPAWAGRTLGACVVGGDPFWVAFDAQAQASVTPAQAAHLQQHAGFPLTILRATEAPKKPAGVKKAKIEAATPAPEED